MNNKLIVTLMVVICILMTGCDFVSSGDSYGSGIFLYVDPTTGVNYLQNTDGGITPRLNPDGSLYVSEVE